jgi:hypothetical protein
MRKIKLYESELKELIEKTVREVANKIEEGPKPVEMSGERIDELFRINGLNIDDVASMTPPIHAEGNWENLFDYEEPEMNEDGFVVGKRGYCDEITARDWWFEELVDDENFLGFMDGLNGITPDERYNIRKCDTSDFSGSKVLQAAFQIRVDEAVEEFTRDYEHDVNSW